MVEADSHLELPPLSILDIWKEFFSSSICCPLALSISLTQLYPPYLAPMLGLWVTCGVKWCDYVMFEADSHLKLLPTSIWDIESVWAHWYAVHGHMVAALHSYTHRTWLIFRGSGSLVESKWCHYVMVEADSHLKLLPTSIWDLYKVFGHIDMLSMGIQYQPYTVIPTILGSDFGALGHLWSQMMWLCYGWGWQPPQTASCIILDIYKVFEHIDMLCIDIW